MRYLLILFFTAISSARPLEYLPAPIDNPLKGLVPYAGEGSKDRFPHSMEFRYIAMNEVMKGPEEFDWVVIERALEETRSRGKQSIFRLYLEYPGKKSAIPQFLVDERLKVTHWKDGQKEIATPDYNDPKLHQALRDCIGALGKKYDGDPRIGFLTAGILGLWGEWHNYPRNDLAAGKKVQKVVMDAYEEAFKKTFVLLRYPAGKNDSSYADNSQTNLGYHDDSFAWATLDTGKKSDGWFFVPLLEKAGAIEKWKRVPIGGEVRPEIWKTTFTDEKTGQQQDFDECVKQTRLSWAMDSGLFSKRFPLPDARRKRAMTSLSKMGYELHLTEATVEGKTLIVKITNRGVAPFYYDWPVEVRSGEVNVPKDWKLSKVLPGEIVTWKMEVADPEKVAIRIPNPMKGGQPLMLANKGYRDGWLELKP